MDRRLTSLAILLLAGFVACEDPFVNPEVRLPLVVTETSVIPSEAARLDQGDLTNISIPFNRPPDAADALQLVLLPPAASAGEVTPSPSGRILTWNNVLPLQGTRVQRLLIDGPSMEAPFLRTWFVGGPTPLGIFRGSVFMDENTGIDPTQTLIFALCVFCDEVSPFNPLQPESFNDQEPLGVALVSGVQSKDDIEASYVMTRLVDRAQFLVVAILDTSGDGRYDPTRDWWGFHGDRLSNDPIVVTARAGFDSIATMVDIELGPPRATKIDAP